MKTKIAVAMSGGVDSSVAALILKEEGHEVLGMTMNLLGDFDWTLGRVRADAAAAAERLDIPHHVIDLHRAFEARIIGSFCREYGRGRTPNPCVDCNRIIKFGLLWEKAAALGAKYLATGHYARIEPVPGGGPWILKKGRSSKKDQSYFLYTLGQEELSRTLFPLGGMTKTEVRKKARVAGLPVAEKEESQEICFIPDDNYPRYLERRIPEAFRPGPIKNPSGRILGNHRGIGRYTVGQRRGLGVSASSPLYVLAIDAASGTILAGPDAGLFHRKLEARRVHWISGKAPVEPMALKARIRYRHKETAARVIPDRAGRVRVEFRRAQRAITPGQSVVFYEGDVVIGGGIIERVLDF